MVSGKEVACIFEYSVVRMRMDVYYKSIRICMTVMMVSGLWLLLLLAISHTRTHINLECLLNQ